MRDSTNIQPQVSLLGDEMVITVPRWMWEKKKSVVVRSMEETPRISAEGGVAAQKKPIDFSSLKGVLKDVPEFKGKTSVEVKHMITQLWAKKYSK